MKSKKEATMEKNYGPFVLSGIAACGLLLLGTQNLPYGYYQFLRIAVSIIAVVYAVGLYQRQFKVLPLIFAGMAILFNPFWPVGFTKELWALIDLVAGFFWGGVAFRVARLPKEGEE